MYFLHTGRSAIRSHSLLSFSDWQCLACSSNFFDEKFGVSFLSSHSDDWLNGSCCHLFGVFDADFLSNSPYPSIHGVLYLKFKYLLTDVIIKYTASVHSQCMGCGVVGIFPIKFRGWILNFWINFLWYFFSKQTFALSVLVYLYPVSGENDERTMCFLFITLFLWVN